MHTTILVRILPCSADLKNSLIYLISLHWAAVGFDYLHVREHCTQLCRSELQHTSRDVKWWASIFFQITAGDGGGVLTYMHILDIQTFNKSINHKILICNFEILIVFFFYLTCISRHVTQSRVRCVLTALFRAVVSITAPLLWPKVELQWVHGARITLPHALTVLSEGWTLNSYRATSVPGFTPTWASLKIFCCHQWKQTY